MTILITGGYGFLCSNIAAKFLPLGERVVLINAMFRHRCEQNLAWLQSLAAPDQLVYCKADTADTEAVESIFQKHGPFDCICHLAGQVAMKTVVFRHSSIFGGRQFSNFDQGWIGWFCQKGIEQQAEMLAGRPVTPFTIQ